MKIQLYSDLHLEWHGDGGISFLQRSKTDADILVITGDICEVHSCYLKADRHNYDYFISKCCQHYPKVIVVGGNHLFYNSSFEKAESYLRELEKVLPNFKYLENQELDNVFGATLWFPYKEDNYKYQGYLNDFRYIEDFVPEVYNRSALTKEALEKTEANIWLFHHLPSYLSVDPKYAGSELNRFFVNNIEDLILEKQPKLVCHGHSHSNCDYYIGNTRVLCNPYGYSRNRRENTEFNYKLVIEI